MVALAVMFPAASADKSPGVSSPPAVWGTVKVFQAKAWVVLVAATKTMKGNEGAIAADVEEDRQTLGSLYMNV